MGGAARRLRPRLPAGVCYLRPLAFLAFESRGPCLGREFARAAINRLTAHRPTRLRGRPTPAPSTGWASRPRRGAPRSSRLRPRCERALIVNLDGHDLCSPCLGQPPVMRHPPVLVRYITGAGGDHGTGKMWNRREISVSCDDDQSHDLHPHPYVAPILGGDRDMGRPISCCSGAISASGRCRFPPGAPPTRRSCAARGCWRGWISAPSKNRRRRRQ
eukprot:COSAG01_NODE_979_length_12356_cov_224.025618_3_plen_217_part_00